MGALSDTNTFFSFASYPNVCFAFRDDMGRVTVGTVDFSKNGKYQITCVSGERKIEREIRRVGTRFESQGWRSAFGTTWLWHWKDDDGKYKEYGKQVPSTGAALDSGVTLDIFSTSHVCIVSVYKISQ